MVERKLLGWFVIFSVLSIAKGGSLELDENLKLNWHINSTKGTIRFTVKAKIDEKGWFMLGFAPQNNKTKEVSLENIVDGDGFVVWKGANKIQRNSPIWKITEIDVKMGTVTKEYHGSHVHLGSSSYDQKTNSLTAVVWRPLKTNNDIEIKHGRPLIVFGSHGSDDGSKIKKWKNKIKQLNNADAINDAFKATQNVDFFKKASKHKGKKSQDKKGIAYAAAIAEKHWIGVVIGISAFLTVLITCSVYCFTKKKKTESRRVVSMPFHKNTDYDDEAKVAFLQSEET